MVYVIILLKCSLGTSVNFRMETVYDRLLIINRAETIQKLIGSQ